MKKETEKKTYTHLGEWEQIPANKRKLVMLVLMYFNEAGNQDEGIKLIRNRWVRKLYPLPRPFHRTYNSQKAVRSKYWGKINDVIREYIVEA